MEAPTVQEPSAQEPAAQEPVADYPDDELEEEFAPHRRERLGKATVLLAVLVIAGGGFLAAHTPRKSQSPAPSAGANRLSFAGPPVEQGLPIEQVEVGRAAHRPVPRLPAAAPVPTTQRPESAPRRRDEARRCRAGW